jgi:hypothetical protein
MPGRPSSHRRWPYRRRPRVHRHRARGHPARVFPPYPHRARQVDPQGLRTPPARTQGPVSTVGLPGRPVDAREPLGSHSGESLERSWRHPASVAAEQDGALLAAVQGSGALGPVLPAWALRVTVWRLGALAGYGLVLAASLAPCSLGRPRSAPHFLRPADSQARFPVTESPPYAPQSTATGGVLGSSYCSGAQ